MTKSRSSNLYKVALTIAGGILMAFLVLGPSNAAAQSKLKKFGEFSDEQTVSVDHSEWNRILQAYIVELEDARTIFKYGDVTDADKKALSDYVNNLEAVDTSDLTKEQAYAYWVNFYNALTIEVVLDGYPVKSIKDLDIFKRGPWHQKLAKVRGVDLTLNNVEHDILRAHWSDPRTHYAVNCASYGCPNLQAVAFTVENTDELLTKGALEFINHERGIFVSDAGSVRASSIYKWYQVDFGDSDEKVLEHVRQYANDDLKAKLEGKTKIDSFEYGWLLNEE